MKKVLVTGATGFIGNYVVEELLSKGFTVIATSSDNTRASGQRWFAKVTYIEFDLKSFDPAQNYFQKFLEPDLLIHLAWEGLPHYKESFHVAENLPRHAAFLNNLIQNGLRDITVTGTCLEYGMKEGCLSEEMEASPASAYAVAKNELRKLLQLLQHDLPFSLKWIRLFYMYGKGQNPNSLFSQLDKAIENKETVFNMSGGEQVRDYLPVEEVAKYIITIAAQNIIDGVVNCCSGRPIKVKDLVENYLAEKQLAIRLNTGHYPYPSYEPMQFWGDATLLQQILSNQTIQPS